VDSASLPSSLVSLVYPQELLAIEDSISSLNAEGLKVNTAEHWWFSTFMIVIFLVRALFVFFHIWFIRYTRRSSRCYPFLHLIIANAAPAQRCSQQRPQMLQARPQIDICPRRRES
jgi:hypothetical protein